MKTDNKEEAKRLEIIKVYLSNYGLPFKYYTFGNETYRDIPKLFLGCVDYVESSEASMSEDRFHPETFERVGKPKRKNERDAPTFSEKMEFVKWMKETITLDQLIERCKEMRVLLKDVTDEMDYIDEEYDELPGLLNKVRRRISDLIKK